MNVVQVKNQTGYNNCIAIGLAVYLVSKNFISSLWNNLN